MAKQLNVNLAFNADTGKAKAQIQELQNLLNKVAYTGATSTATGKMQQDLMKASAAAKELQYHLNNAFNATTGRFDLSMLDKSLRTSKSNIASLSTQLLGAGTTGQQAFLKLAQSISMADQPMLRISNRMREFGTVMKNTIKWQLSSSMIHGFMGAINSAYGYAQDLNASLNDIRIVTGQSTEQMAKFATEANKAAKALSTTTTDYTKASLIYYQQGLSDSEVAKRTEVTIKMANAAGQSAQTVSDQLTAVWNNFYDGSKSLEYYADVMTALGAATASSTDEISQGLQKFAAVAETVGLSYEYATAALATITSNTRESADVVGTALKTLFARIQGLQLGETLEDGTNLNKYSQALAKVGISIYESNGELKAMDNILSEMAAKWDTMNNAQQTALAQTVAGVRQYTQLVALMENWDNGDGDSFQANLNTALNSEGSLSKQADIYAESWEAAEKQVKASAESIFQNLLNDKFFISVNKGLSNLLDGINSFIEGLGGVKPLISGIASLFLMNFANKIPQALENLKYNFQMLLPGGTQKAYSKIQNDMNAATQKAFQERKIDSNSSTGYAIQQANELTAARSKLALVSNQMSDIERQAAETQLSLIASEQEAIIALKQKNEELEKSISLRIRSMQVSTGEAYQTGNEQGNRQARKINFEVLGLSDQTDLGAMGGEMYEALAIKISQSMQDAKNSGKDFTEATIANFDLIKASGPEVSNAFINIKAQINSLNDNANISNLKSSIQDFINILPPGVKNIDAVKQALNNLKQSGTKNELLTNFTNLHNILQSLNADASSLGPIIQSILKTNGTALYNDMMQLANNTAEANSRAEILKNTLNGFQPQHTIRMSEALGRLAGIAGSAAMAFRGIGSAFSALSNPDLSGWEKFLSVLTAISMVIPGMISIFTALKTLISQETVVKIANAAATLAQAAAEKKLNTEKGSSKKITSKNIKETIQDTKNKLQNSAKKRTDAWNQGVWDKLDDKAKDSYIDKVMRKKGYTPVNGGGGLKGGWKLGQGHSAATAAKGGVLPDAAAQAEAMGMAGKSAFASMAGGAALIALGVAAAVGAVAWGVHQFNKQAKAADEAAVAAGKAAEAYERVSQTYQQFNNTVSNYNNAKQQLDGLTRGTLEYRDAVLSANAAAMDLVNTYDGLTYTTDAETGLITLDEKSVESVKKQQLDRVQNAQMANQIAAQNSRDKALESEKTDFARDKIKSTSGTWANIGNVFAATAAGAGSGALIGAGLGLLGGPFAALTSTIGAIGGAIIGGIAGLTTGIISVVEAGSASKKEEAALEQLGEIYAKEGNKRFQDNETFEKMLREDLKLDDENLIASLVANRESTMALAEQMANNAAQEKAKNEQAVATEYGEEIAKKVSDENVAKAVNAAMGAQLGSRAEELYETKYKDGKGMKDKDIQKAYAEAMGWNVNKIDNLNKNKATYYDSKGNKVAESLDDETARRFLAQQEAMEELGVNMTTYINTVQELMSAGKGLGDNVGNGLLNFSGGGSGDLSGLTQSEFANMQKDGMLSGFDEANQSFTFNGITFNDEKAKAMGYENAKAFYDAFTKEMETVQAAWDTMDTDFMKSAGLDSSIVDNMSLSTAQSITSALENINLGPLGEAGGQEFIQGLNKMISSGDLNAEEQQKALAQLADIDWSSWDAMEQAEAIMKSFGVEIDSTSDEWIAFTENMRIAAGAAPDYSKLKADLNAITSILNNLDFGKVISEEDYQRLVQYNDEWERFFILQADGSRKFIGDSSEMQRQTQNNIREQRQQLKERKGVQQDFADAGWNVNGNEDIDWSSYDGTAEGSWNTATNLVNSSSGKAVLDILGYDPQKVLEQIEAAKSGNEEAQKWLDEMFNRIEAFENEDLDLAGEELSEMMASTATNFTELNQLMANGEISPEAYSKQFSYLATSGIQAATSLDELNSIMSQIISEKGNTADFYDTYAQKLMELASQYSICTDEILAYQSALHSGDSKTIKLAEDNLQASIYLGESAKNYGLSEKALSIQSKALAKEYKLTAKQAAILAVENQRMNKGIQKLTDNWEKWGKILKQSDHTTQDWAEAAAECTEVIADLVGASEDLELPEDFFNTENLELLEKAAKGDTDAINQLGLEVAKAQIQMIKFQRGMTQVGANGKSYDVSTHQFTNWKNTILNGIQAVQDSLSNIKIGDNIYEQLGGSKWVNALNEMAQATNMSVEQMNSMLNSMGVQADVTTIEKTVPIKVPVYTTTEEVTESPGVNGGPTTYTKVSKTVQTGVETMDGVISVAQINTGDSAGTPPSVTYVGNGSAGGGGGSSGGGGGGGGNSKPKKAEKVKKSEVVTRYKEVDDSLDDVADVLSEIEELNDRLYGADKLKQMQKVNDLLRKEVELNKQKKQEAQQYLDLDRKELQQAAAEAGITFEFDDNGNISNYTEQMTKLYEELDSAIESANADGNADEDEQEYIDNIQEKIDKVTEAIEQYEETRELITDLDAEMRDKLNEIYDNEIEAFQYKVELDLELSDDALSIIEFQLGQIEDDAFKAAESIALTSKQAETLYDKLMTSRTALDEASGLSDIAWDLGLLEEGQEFTEAQIDLMKEYRDNIMDVIEEMSELRETVEGQVMEVFDAWNDKLETNMDTLDHFGSMLDSYKNIVDIVGQDTMGLSEGFMQNMQNASVEHALDQMQATKEAYETMMSARLRAEQALEDARARGDDASAKMWEETLTELNSNMESAQEDMLSAWEEALSTIQDNFEATVERVVETFNNAVYAFGGMEGLSNEFSRQKEMADLMVDDYQKIYELSKLNRDIQKTLDDTDVIAGKQKLLKLQEKINALEEEGVELSQYDLEYLQAEYELRMAEIELANAQAKKDTVRLSKDNEGNWSYIYTTSTDAVDEAQQKYEDALYAMQELSSNYVDEMSEQLISTSQEMAEALAEVRASDFASQEDYEKELDRIRKMYQERLDQQEAELQKSINNNKDLYTQDWTNYHEATGYKISDTENFVTSFKDSMLGTLMQSESDTANFNNIMSSAVDILTTGLVDAATTYYLHMEQAMQAAGTSTNDFAADMQENIDTVVQKSEEGAAAVEEMAEKMASAFWDITDSVTQWQEGYGAAMQQVIDSNLAVVESFNNMLKELSIDPDSIKVEYDISTDYGLEDASSMDTGGYTGTWGTAGKLAILHEKELVLNPDDTSNFLQAIGISKTLLETIDLNARQASNGMGLLSATGFKDSSNGTLEQNVHIEATFPNVTDHNEIEEAMKNLVNTASQYANRK